jgi:hypothetical protein
VPRNTRKVGEREGQSAAAFEEGQLADSPRTC